MKNYHGVLKISFVISILFAFIPGLCFSEFYQYVNEEGVVCFTDDLSEVETNKRQGLFTHKEKYDGLEEKQKAILLQKENETIEKLQKKTQEALRQFEEIERLQSIEQAKLDEETLTTQFDLSQNRVLVPVTIGYDDREITTRLVLDTGASITAINQNVATELEIDSMTDSFASVAGGAVISTKLAKVQYIKVGPKKLAFTGVMILPQLGPVTDYQGLLGQNFLQHFSYTIDYSKNVIRWAD